VKKTRERKNDFLCDPLAELRRNALDFRPVALKRLVLLAILKILPVRGRYHRLVLGQLAGADSAKAREKLDSCGAARQPQIRRSRSSTRRCPVFGGTAAGGTPRPTANVPLSGPTACFSRGTTPAGVGVRIA
jgi:hypothetical protein